MRVISQPRSYLSSYLYLYFKALPSPPRNLRQVRREKQHLCHPQVSWEWLSKGMSWKWFGEPLPSTLPLLRLEIALATVISKTRASPSRFLSIQLLPSFPDGPMLDSWNHHLPTWL
jgi:hypothetical protein